MKLPKIGSKYNEAICNREIVLTSWMEGRVYFQLIAFIYAQKFPQRNAVTISKYSVGIRLEMRLPGDNDYRTIHSESFSNKVDRECMKFYLEVIKDWILPSCSDKEYQVKVFVNRAEIFFKDWEVWRE